MKPKLGVLIIHGVGSQGANFAEPMKKKLIARISDHAKIRWKSIYWAPELSDRERDLLNDLFPEEKRPHCRCRLGYWIFKLRTFVVNYAGDATAYRYVPNISDHTKKTNVTYDRIHDRVHEAIVKLRKRLGSADKPVIVIAHSLGSVIMSDYIWDRQNNKNAALYGATPFERMETLAGFITFGSPIPLFTLAYTPVESITFPPNNLQANLKDKAKWLNFYDEDDVLGWPLKHLSTSYKNAVTDDFPINVGLTPLCHHGYWTDNSFTEPVAEYISKILNLC